MGKIDDRTEEVLVEITRNTRNADIETFVENNVTSLDEIQLKKIYYSVEYAILASMGDLIQICPYYKEKEVAAVIANRAFYNYRHVTNG